MTVQKACKDILIKEPFYGFILMSLNKHVTQNEASCKTLQVELHGISFTLVVTVFCIYILCFSSNHLNAC